MKILKSIIVKLLSIFEEPITWVAAKWLKYAAWQKRSEKVLMKVGVYPIIDHYYWPLINPKKYLKKSLREDRHLPGINLNVSIQLDLLKNFNFNEELLQFSIDGNGHDHFYYNNNNFESGDAEFLYSMIRYLKPKNIIEIGSGFSTLLMLEAINKNWRENKNDQCLLTCVDPYSRLNTKKRNIKIIDKPVESLDPVFFQILTQNDILFIDSSHVIRPQGDVLFEYLEILPILQSGVIVHSHDIFTPKDYLDDWVIHQHLLWNEQYLLEAFLSNNNKFEVIGAVNFLAHHYKKELSEIAPVFAQQKDREPGSFWIRKC